MVLCWMWLIIIVFLQVPAKEGFLSSGCFVTKVSFMSRVMLVTEVRHKASFLALQDSEQTELTQSKTLPTST